MNPPIRSQADQDALWDALADGTIAHVTTDHAPFSRAEKQAAERDFLSAPPGVPGVEVMLPAMLDAVAAGRLTLEHAVALLSTNGARLHGLFPRKGAILPESDADLVLVDRAATTTISAATLHTQAREVAQLFEGRRFTGAVRRTILAGRTVFADGAVSGIRGGGRFVSPAPVQAGRSR